MDRVYDTLPCLSPIESFVLPFSRYYTGHHHPLLAHTGWLAHPKCSIFSRPIKCLYDNGRGISGLPLAGYNDFAMGIAKFEFNRGRGVGEN